MPTPSNGRVARLTAGCPTALLSGGWTALWLAHIQGNQAASDADQLHSQ
ncbi:hypothetical protein [Streptomyces sp. NPDC053427]